MSPKFGCNRILRKIVTLLSAALLAGCAPAANPPAPPTASAPTPSSTPAITQVLLPSATRTSTALPPTSTPPAAPRLCSPLAGARLPDLPAMITNPYHPPPPGFDDPHEAIDLSIRLPNSQVAVAGSPIQSALAGQVAAVISDRFPYGNAILIETPLEQFPLDWWASAALPTPAPTLAPRSALTCPASPNPRIPDPARRSLYVLYAHMQQPPGLQIGQQVICGQTIGAVGGTGNALNPHLHFETRVGPSAMQFSSMAHYDASASLEEMRNYCLWRVSGLFQLVDPNQVLQLAP